jgi:hypothetical protein
MRDNRIKSFVLRGLAAGAAGGVAAALFLRFVTETQIGYALRFEDATGIGLPPGEPAEFSRPTQQWGGMLGAVIFGMVLGVVLGVTVAALHHRIAARTEFGRVVRVAAAGFVAVVLIPSLKYPPNPPTVGDPETIGERTITYLLLLAASIVVVFAAWVLWQRLTERGWDGAPRFLVAGSAFALMVAVLFLAYPASPDRIAPPDNDAAPALRVADDAPPEVLAAVLATAREVDDPAIRDPDDPDQPLDLDSVAAEDLAGAPVAVNTTKLVANAYTTVVWHFRLQSIAGLALLWAAMAVVFGLLSDPVRVPGRVTVPAVAEPGGVT